MVSYRKNSIKSKFHKIRPRKSIFLRLWFWLSLLIFSTVIYILYLLVFYSGFQLKNIVISGNNKIKTQDLQNVVSEYAVTGLINFWDIKINSGSIFLINKNRIRTDILEKFPAIEDLIINKQLPQTLNLNVIERQPLGIFCSLISPKQGDRCFLIDHNGIIYKEIDKGFNDIFIVRQDKDNNQIVIGEQVVAQDIIKAIYKVKNNLNDNFKIGLNKVLIKNSLRLNFTTNENWEIYFDLDDNYNIDSQIAKLFFLLNGGVSESKEPLIRNNLRYIDLRPKDRAIVCDNSTCGQ